MRVGHAVECDDPGRMPLPRPRQILEPPPIERFHFQGRTLMDGAGVERDGELAWIHDLGFQPTCRDGIRPQTVGSIPGQDQPKPVAHRVAQRIPDGVQSEQPDGRGGRGAATPFLVDHPSRFARHAGL